MSWLTPFKAVIGLSTLIFHFFALPLYTPRVEFPRPNPKKDRSIFERKLTIAVSQISKISSSCLNIQMWKSSDPTISSGYPSKSISTLSNDLTLSPVTVQYESLPSLSNPVIEQFPPATINGSQMEWILVKWRQFTPSGTSTSNLSVFSVKSYAKRFVRDPINKTSLLWLESIDPPAMQVISLLMLRKVTSF